MKTTTMATLLCAVLAACGGGDGGDAQSACEAAHSELCELACDCTDGVECGIVTGGVTLTHDNLQDCLGFWVNFGCSQSSNVDFGECLPAVESATCMTVGDDDFAEFPMECGEVPNPQ